jgi:predicted nucleic acid-binding protein
VATEFVDSNVVLYFLADDPKTDAAEELLRRRPIISVQVLNEVVAVARRKLGMSWLEVREAIAIVRTLCPTVLPLDVATHADALRLAERYGHTIYDSLIIASALQARSEILWSEDMQHGMVIDGRLRIANPFRAAS